MNTAKEILLKVKALFDVPVAPAIPVAPVVAAAPVVAPVGTPTPFKLQDGTEIMIVIDDPAVSATPDTGDAVTIAGAPAPAADYTLEDGSVITVDDMGTIVSVVTPVVDPVAAPSDMSVLLEQRIAALEEEVTKLREPITTMNADTTAAFSKQENEITKQGEIIKGLFELVEELIKEPSTEPKTLTGAQKEKFDKVAAKEKKFEAYAKAISNLKNNK